MDFEEIRPYNDEELPQIFEELIADPAFRRAAATVLPDVPFEGVAQKMRGCKTKLDFQKTFCYSLLHKLAAETTTGVTLDLSAMADREKPYVYISNHRDIILDSGFLSVELIDKAMDTVEIAIGDNLLIYPWIKKFVRVNKSFIVQRALTMRQMLESSTRMSRYIHYTIREKKQSIWIAQREGRAKDANDRTQDSVLKMLAMGGEGNTVIDRLLDLNLAPLAISYEYDPCDFLKAREFQLKRDDPDYKKSQEDDLMNMQTGLFGYKGHVHFQVSECINDELEKIDHSLSKPELFALISTLIDQRIHANYCLYPGNYVAHDCLSNTNAFVGNYTPEQKDVFLSYVEQQLARIELPNKDIPFLREKILLMYANPLTNYLAAISNRSN